ncbi:MAG: DUF3035 domain-containing protein [Planktomarina sp.]
MLRSGILTGVALLALTACGGTGGNLHDFRSNSAGPDAFVILPNKTLEQPADFKQLPQPTLGASNRADATPARDVAILLGGGTSRQSGDGALLNAAGRFGTNPEIRAELDEGDASFRRLRGRLAVGGRTAKYFRVYASMALDAYAELLRFRKAGVRTPSAPPK